MKVVGVDAGSRAIKLVLYDSESGRPLETGLVDQGIEQAALAEEVLVTVLGTAGAERSDVTRAIATGYGRQAITWADKTVTEITCHARGVLHLHSDARTVIDIGGQDSKLIRLDENGHVHDFVMNDRCAAGTGRFLEVVAKRLGVAVSELGDVARQADAPSAISSMCVVFAETEIIGLLAAGERPENIVAGVQHSIATRLAAMSGGHLVEPVYFTGGVAQVSGMDAALREALECPIQLASMPAWTGALGAAILASE